MECLKYMTTITVEGPELNGCIRCIRCKSLQFFLLINKVSEVGLGWLGEMLGEVGGCWVGGSHGSVNLKAQESTCLIEILIKFRYLCNFLNLHSFYLS